MMYEQEQQTLQFIERQDAWAGYVLLAALEDSWFRAGVEAARAGQPAEE